MSWDSPTIAAANGAIAFPFFALALDLPAVGSIPAKTLRLLDGAGTVTFGGYTWVGQDADYGSWAAADVFEDGVALQSSRIQASLSLLTANATAQVASPYSQGAPFTIYLGFMNQATGAPVSTPVTVRTGFLDISKVTLGKNSKAIDCDLVGAFEWLTFPNDGERLSSGYHNLFFPTETGFDYVDNVTHTLPWGQSGPRPDQVTQVRNYDTGFSPAGGSGGSGGAYGGGLGGGRGFSSPFLGAGV